MVVDQAQDNIGTDTKNVGNIWVNINIDAHACYGDRHRIGAAAGVRRYCGVYHCLPCYHSNRVARRVSYSLPQRIHPNDIGHIGSSQQQHRRITGIDNIVINSDYWWGSPDYSG